MSAEFTQYRDPSESERRLLTLLAEEARDMAPDWLVQLQVNEMDDGGMGSLRLMTLGTSKAERRFGRKVAELQFTDADDVEVIATLTVDEDGCPFELDIWKTDFSSLIRVPPDDELRAKTRKA